MSPNEHIYKTDFDQFLKVSLVKSENDWLHQMKHTIILVNNGVANCSIDKKAYSLDNSSIIMLSKNSKIVLNDLQDFEALVYEFDERYFQNEINDYFVFLLFKLFGPNQICYKLKKHDHTALNNVAQALLLEYRNTNTKLKEHILPILFKALLIKLETSIELENSADLMHPNNDHMIYVKFMRLLNKRLNSSDNINRYATELNVTPKKLLEATRRVAGETPSEIIKQRLIIEAKRLLKGNQYSIKEIATILGFEYPANFSQFFKKVTKSSPKDYRNSLSVINK